MNAIASGPIAKLVGLSLVTVSLSGPVSAQLPQPSQVASPPRVEISNQAGLHADGESRLVGGGERYRAYFTKDAMRFHPALGVAAPELQHLELTPVSVARGGRSLAQGPVRVAPTQDGLQVQYRHGASVTERYDVHPQGMELSWRFDERPTGTGDLVVRYAVDTSLAQVVRTELGGYELSLPGVGGVSIGAVTGIDSQGLQVAGDLHYDNGQLSMSLPGSFVEEAAYPIVLDPLIGTVVNVIAAANTYKEPDAAYDATNDRYLVTCKHIFSATAEWPRGQMVGGDGVAVGGVIFFSGQGKAGRVRVANLDWMDRFGVVWSQQEFATSSVKFAAVDAATGNISHTAVLATSSGVDLFRDADIGASSGGPQQFDRGFVVVFEDNIQDAIRARRVYFSATDQLVSPSAHNVFADQGGVGSAYTQPAICRCAGLDDRFLVAVRRFSGLGPALRTSVAVVHGSSSAVGPTGSFGIVVGGALGDPDVDGYGTSWTVAWQQSNTTTSPSNVIRATVNLDLQAGAPGTLVLGPTSSLGGGISNAQAPSLAYAPGRTWLGYRWNSNFGNSLRAAAVDTGSSTWCGDVFTESVVPGSTDTRIVVATMASGGDLTGEFALAVFAEAGNIYGQRLQNFGATGSIVNVGGGCGLGGVQAFNHAPGIGSSNMGCNISGLSGSALVSVFNLVSGSNALTCGPCVWETFGATSVQPVVFGEASTFFPIPCLPSLVGSVMHSQWTTLDPTQAPCSLAAGFAVSDRSMWTLGQ